MTWEIRQGDALDRLREMPDESVQCCVTSPPYFGLRDYGVDGQIGLEETLDDFLDRLVEVFAEVRRVLRSDGTLWLNIGDSWNSGTSARRRPAGKDGYGKHGYWSNPHIANRVCSADSKPKDLMMVPALLALALRADGWWLRSEIIWHKPTPMPESVRDRPTKAHEPIYLLTKAPRYYYDAEAIREPLAPKTLTTFGTSRQSKGGGDLVQADNWARDVPERKPKVDSEGEPVGANKRSVWTVHSGQFPDAHFATFPPALIEPCVLAGTPAQACGECRAPWQRMTERPKSGDLGARTLGHDERVTGNSRNAIPGGSKPYEGVRTIGFQPTCEHSQGGGHLSDP